MQPRIDPRRLVFLDETGAKTNMARTHGRSLRGTRLVAKIPFGHWKSLTFVGAMRSTGWVAPLVVRGAMNGATFLAYVEQHLAPSLAAGDILVLDNLACHKVKGVREALARVGVKVWYLPAYSPDLNPIEQAFSKLKRLLRTAGERTVEGLEKLFATLLTKFHASEFPNYIQNSGYRYS